MLQRDPVPVVICEMEGQWKSLLERIDSVKPTPRVIVASHDADDHVWADVLESGGYHVLEIPLDARQVFKAVSEAWRSWNFACHAESAGLLAAADAVFINPGV